MKSQPQRDARGTARTFQVVQGGTRIAVVFMFFDVGGGFSFQERFSVLIPKRGTCRISDILSVHSVHLASLGKPPLDCQHGVFFQSRSFPQLCLGICLGLSPFLCTSEHEFDDGDSPCDCRNSHVMAAYLKYKG